MKTMTTEKIKNYLNERITNWYKNAEIDYGVTGKFIDIEVMGDDLKIIFEEKGRRLYSIIAYFEDYTAEQIFDIWLEFDWFEEEGKPVEVPVQREENLMRDLKLKGIEIAIKALQEQPLSAEQITAYAHLINACSINCW